MKRTAEFTLSLIASILLILFWFLSLAATIGSGNSTDYSSEFFFTYYLITTIIFVPLIVLEWIATFKIRKGSKGWGIYSLVVGIFSLPSMFFISGVLMLIAGIMMIARHPENIKYDDSKIITH